MKIQNDLPHAIRVLTADAVEAAQSGHPGMPMGMAEIATVLWKKHLSYNPKNPKWANRDRVIVSNGHGSMLLYSVNYLTGYKISLEDIKAFRQLGSVTAGHPEYEIDYGIETTTGPLGQGVSNAVGMAIAEKQLNKKYKFNDFSPIDHFTFVLLGDGCLMEGISHEACSLAGTLGLGKLILLYDDNSISIDGETKGWFSDNTPERFKSYGWQVLEDIDGHNMEAIDEAIQCAKSNQGQPSIICFKTIIGKGSPNKAGKASSHGAPLGKEEIDHLKLETDWDKDPFHIPQNILDQWSHQDQGMKAESEWIEKFKQNSPEIGIEDFINLISTKFPHNWDDLKRDIIASTASKEESKATRQCSQDALEKIYPYLSMLFGGSADLTGSNNTKVNASTVFSKDNELGNYMHYGVREFGMAGIMNGLSLYGSHIPYSGTFLVFSDYSKNAIRMSALMKIRTIHVFTHDSIGLGEDGPTHQPIEHLTSLRSIPNVHVWRPCDSVETVVAWLCSLDKCHGPSALALTRQKIPFMSRTQEQIEHISKGGYILYNSPNNARVVLVASGSEVHIGYEAALKLEENGIPCRVVSMPCMETFFEQEQTYRDHVLPDHTYKVTIEAAHSMPWWKIIGNHGHAISIDEFGASAPASDLFKKYNITTDEVVNSVLANIGD